MNLVTAALSSRTFTECNVWSGTTQISSEVLNLKAKGEGA
jgi:hypothetical protein